MTNDNALDDEGYRPPKVPGLLEQIRALEQQTNDNAASGGALMDERAAFERWYASPARASLSHLSRADAWIVWYARATSGGAPREPTEAMVAAANIAWYGEAAHDEDDLRVVWRAMWDASPTPSDPHKFGCPCHECGQRFYTATESTDGQKGNKAVASAERSESAVRHPTQGDSAEYLAPSTQPEATGLVERLRKMARCVYLACEASVADDIADGLTKAAARIEQLERAHKSIRHLNGTLIDKLDSAEARLAKVIAAGNALRMEVEWWCEEHDYMSDVSAERLAAWDRAIGETKAETQGRGWIATHTNGKVLHLSELDGWTIEQVVG